MRRFFREMPHVALDKRANFEYIEREVGMHKFLPAAVADPEANSHKTLRKLIQGQFRKCAALNDRECMFRFIETLAANAAGNAGIHAEVFKCAMGVNAIHVQYLIDHIIVLTIHFFQSGWSIPVEIVIGPHKGIAYATDSSAQVRDQVMNGN